MEPFRLAHRWRFEPKPRFVIEMRFGLAHIGLEFGLKLKHPAQVDGKMMS